MSLISCLASSSPCCWDDCGSSWSYSPTFSTKIFYTVLESGAAKAKNFSDDVQCHLHEF